MSVLDSVQEQFSEKKDDLIGIFLVTGIVIVSAIAWFQILRPVGKVVEEVVDTATGG